MTQRCDDRVTRAAYALGAGAYDDAWSPFILPPAEALVRRLDLASASCVLDVGAGTGALTPALRAAAPYATIISIDPAWEMLRYAQQRRQVTPTLADAAALPIAPGTVDAVLLAYVLFMMPDPSDGLHEVTRALRPGGTRRDRDVGIRRTVARGEDVGCNPRRVRRPCIACPQQPQRARHRRPCLDAVDRVRD